MAPVVGLSPLDVLAHGGTAGAIVELILVAGVVAVMLAVWVGRRGDEDEP
jgi:adenine/guanine phosphoribosyltransferase-like PRPP-binding protein